MVVETVGSIFSAVIYFAPSIVAYNNCRYKFKPIFWLNLLTGWTGIGWVVALVWSIKPDLFDNESNYH